MQLGESWEDESSEDSHDEAQDESQDEEETSSDEDSNEEDVAVATCQYSSNPGYMAFRAEAVRIYNRRIDALAKRNSAQKKPRTK